MRKIRLRNTYTIQAVDDQEHILDLNALSQRMKALGENKLSIIENAYTIENELERNIAYFFFGRDEKTQDKKRVFEEQILRSSWCTFASKRKLIMHIVNSLSVFDTKKDNNSYDSALRKIMSYRNAFTHGHLTNIGDEVKLTWFEGTTREKVLTDDYWLKIESDFINCIELTEKMAIKIGAVRIAKSANDPK